MIDPLKFVQRGVAKQDLVPSLLHFRIVDGRVTGHNGTLALSAVVPLSFNAAPLAMPFIKALDACEGAMLITQSSASLIIIKSGTFKAEVPCIAVSQVPRVVPEGEIHRVDGITEALRNLKPFISTNPNYLWANGCLINGQSIFVTNNITVVEHWISTPLPRMTIPVNLIDELIRIKEEPTRIQVSETSVTFHYADGKWIRSQVTYLDWPNVADLLNHAWTNKQPQLTPQFKADCQKLANFTSREAGTTFFKGISATVGTLGVATIEGTFPAAGKYATAYLNSVVEVATHADFAMYPKPVPWRNDVLRGVLLGVRE